MAKVNKSQLDKFKETARLSTDDDLMRFDEPGEAGGAGAGDGEVTTAVITPRWAWAVYLIAMATIAYFSTPSWIVRFIVFLWLTVPIIWWTRRQVRKLAVKKGK